MLSGGGAKGMAHIGLIRALEENNIPIDYVTGTSMGAIIGSLYAMGYTPDEMEELIASDDFRRWYGAENDNSYQFYFKQPEPKPELGSIAMDFSDSTMTLKLNRISLINPKQMNLGFVDVFSGATAACEGDFNKLFVPFRAVASDVYNKKTIVLSHGDLSDAVRSSMTFPLVFKPIIIDSVSAYDGGIYDNFPLDVMMDEFHPDFVIGSIVSSSDPLPDEYDLYAQIRSLIIQGSDYNLPDTLGVCFEFPELENIGLLDFNLISQVTKAGYDAVSQLADSIKGRTEARRDFATVQKARSQFKKRIPDIVFKDIIVTGTTKEQADYIEREFRQELGKTFDYEGLKKGYFHVLSDEAINEIVPKTVFNPEDSTYTLILDTHIDETPVLHFGIGLSTLSTSQLYAGISYKTVQDFSVDYMLEGQMGRSYNTAQLNTRFDLAGQLPMSFDVLLGLSNVNYYNQNFLLTNAFNPAFNKDMEYMAKIKMSLPFLNNDKAVFSIGVASHKDFYTQSSTINTREFNYDASRYRILGGGIKFTGTTLNSLQYATSGRSETILAQLFTSGEQYLENNLLPTGLNEDEFKKQSWLQMSAEFQNYIDMAPRFTLGTYLKASYSSRNFSENYYASMMQASAFTPTVNSQFIYDNRFRAYKWFALGLKPIYKINSVFHFRTELYSFIPIRPVLCNDLGNAYNGDPLSEPAFLAELSMVAKVNNITATAFMGLTADKYSIDSPSFGLTVGITMMHERFIE